MIFNLAGATPVSLLIPVVAPVTIIFSWATTSTTAVVSVASTHAYAIFMLSGFGACRENAYSRSLLTIHTTTTVGRGWGGYRRKSGKENESLKGHTLEPFFLSFFIF